MKTAALCTSLPREAPAPKAAVLLTVSSGGGGVGAEGSRRTRLPRSWACRDKGDLALLRWGRVWAHLPRLFTLFVLSRAAYIVFGEHLHRYREQLSFALGNPTPSNLDSNASCESRSGQRVRISYAMPIPSPLRRQVRKS